MHNRECAWRTTKSRLEPGPVGEKKGPLKARLEDKLSQDEGKRILEGGCCVVAESGLVVTVSLATQQMLWVGGKSVVGMETSSDPGFKYCYSLAQQAKHL